MIMLIDDRTIRQTKFTDKTGIYLDEYSDVLSNYTAESYDALLEKFRNNDFSELNDYDTIITHRSAYGEINSQVLDEIKNICEKENKKLVFFSGGISSVTYKKKPFEFLLLNSKIIYSENIKVFLENSKINDSIILQLAYGTKWHLSVLLNVLEKINLFIGSNLSKEMVSYKNFKKLTTLDTIANFLNFNEPELENGGVKMSDLIQLSNSISNQIKQQAVLDV